jgi:hypothetical protein
MLLAVTARPPRADSAPVFRYYPYIPGDYLPDGVRLWHVTDDPEEAARAERSRLSESNR